MTSLRAVVFDFDGVILESADVKTHAFVELYAAHGADVQAAVRDYHLANLGISRFKKFAWIAEHVLGGGALSDADSRALGDRFSALAYDKVLAAPFVPGAREALAALGHLPLFVASGTPQDELDQIVDRRELRGAFREVWGSPAEKAAVVRDLLARHGLAAAETLFIGDGLTDYRAATAAGVEFLARDTPDLHDQWIALGVRMRPDLRELPELIAAW